MATEMKKAKVKMNKPIYLVFKHQILAKHLCINFDMITLNKNIKTEQNYVTWILTALLFILKLKIYMKILLITLRNGLSNLTMMNMIKERFQQVRTKKVIGLFKDELGRKIMEEFVVLRAKNIFKLNV